MAQIDIGKIKLVWRGTYAAGTAYTPDDVVAYTDSGITSSYICVANTTGNAPSTSGTAHASWNYLAKGVANELSGISNSNIIYKNSSGNVAGLALGSANQQLRVNSGGSDLEFATIQGFDGTYKFHNFQRYSHTSSVSVGTLNGGEADGQRDCVVIGNGNYFTINAAHNDDVFEFVAGVNYYIPANNAYGGLGFMSSTATDFSANRVFLFRSGQHSMGNGSGGGDEYAFKWVNYMKTASDLGFSVGTTYYVRVIGQKHTTNNTLFFNNSTGTNNDGQHYAYCKHWKKQT